MEAVRDARRGASAHADDRPHPRRPRRADDLRSEARALVRRAAARPRSRCCARATSSRSARFPARSARSRTSTRRSKRASASGSGCEPAPVSSQVIQRDRHAELMSALAITAASLEKFALEIRGPAEDGDRRGRGAVRQGAEGLVGDAAQAQSDRLRADRRAGAAHPRATRWRRSRTSRSGTSATSRTRRSSASSCPTASSRSITCCGASRASCKGMVVYPGADAART